MSMEVYIHNVFVLKDILELIVNVIEKKNLNEKLKFLFVFLATICSSTSCNGGVCTAAQNSFVCACPTGKVGDRCQVRFLF
jgi:hypothetical protein